MKIALIADVHSNLPALENVLRDAEERGADRLWSLGDFIGYCPYPEEVVERLRKEKGKSISGNYDTKILAFKKKKASPAVKRKDPVKFFSLRWTRKHISRSTRKYLKKLPARLLLEKEGRKFLFVHGTPDSADEPLKPDTSRERFSELAKKADVDVVLCAHSHLFFDKCVDGVRFINPGSVGKPFDNDPRASYAILDITEKKLTVSNIRIDYDMNKLLEEMKNEKFPQELLQAVIQGKSLDRISSPLIPSESRRGGRQEKKPIDRTELMKQVLKLAEACDYEKEHSRQVTMVALKLFDNLKTLHNLDHRRERALLEAAALLHDIGWINGCTKHHKTARDIILKSKGLPLDKEEKTITALTARYHRRALPEKFHKYYSSLTRCSRDIVDMLSSFLRLADGLDRSHLSLIKDLNCEILPKKVVLHIKSEGFSDTDKQTGKKKADLFEKVFKRELIIDWS